MPLFALAFVILPALSKKFMPASMRSPRFSVAAFVVRRCGAEMKAADAEDRDLQPVLPSGCFGIGFGSCYSAPWRSPPGERCAGLPLEKSASRRSHWLHCSLQSAGKGLPVLSVACNISFTSFCFYRAGNRAPGAPRDCRISAKPCRARSARPRPTMRTRSRSACISAGDIGLKFCAIFRFCCSTSGLSMPVIVVATGRLIA